MCLKLFAPCRIARLLAERDRTGVDHNRLFRLQAGDLEGVRVYTVRGWMNRSLRSAERAALDAVFAAYAALPDKAPQF